MKLIAYFSFVTFSVFIFVGCLSILKDDKSHVNISCLDCAGLEVSLTRFNILPNGPKQVYLSKFDTLGQAQIEFVQNDTLSLLLVVGNENQSERKFSTTLYIEPGTDIDLAIENGLPKFEGDLRTVNSYFGKIDSIEIERNKFVNANLIKSITASPLEKQAYLDSLMQYGTGLKKEIEMNSSISDYYRQIIINHNSLFEVMQRMYFDTQVSRIESNDNGASVFLDSTLSTAFKNLTLDPNYIDHPSYTWHLSNRLMLIFDDILNYRYENNIKIAEYQYVSGAILKDIKLNNYRELLMALFVDYMSYDNRLDYTQELRLVDMFAKDYPRSKYLSGLNYILTNYNDLRPGRPMKDIEMHDVYGRVFRLSDLVGNLVYIDIWATWCGPCVNELQYSVKLSKKYSNHSDLKFLYISIDDDTRVWKKFLNRNPRTKGLHGIQNTGLVADSSMVTKLYKFNGIPRYMLIDKRGNIVTTNAKHPSELLSSTYLDSLLSLR